MGLLNPKGRALKRRVKKAPKKVDKVVKKKQDKDKS